MLTQQNTFRVGDLDIDFGAYRLYRNHELIRLTRTEWSLLRELVNHKNQVLSHNQLLHRVWGQEYNDESDYVHTYVSRLRRKLEYDTTNPQYIITEPGIGYRFQADDSRTIIAPPLSPTDDVRVINPLPQRVDDRFIGREREQQLLLDLLEKRTRLISIYGRAGIGKTALVCKVLADLQTPNARIPIDGMVFLSAASTGIGMARIFADFERLLGDDKSELDSGELAQRITALLERLSRGNYILLLDNLESVQNSATGELLDADLQLFFKMVVEQSGALRIIITSREPLFIPASTRTYERRLELNEGLSPEDSIALLRRCDVDGKAGLRDASAELLGRIAEGTRGYPRALEAVVSLLVEDPFLTPENLVDETFPASDEISEVLVAQALERLDDVSQRVMQIMAAFRTPIVMDELEHIATRYLPQGTKLRHILQRLIQTHFLAYDSVNKHITIHPLDRDYCYSRIPASGGDFNLIALHRDIAALHKAEQSEVDEDIEPYLNEFNHLVRAESYTEAANLLLHLDRTHLSQENFHADAADMYSRVVPHLPQSALLRTCLLRQGEAYRRIARLGEAMHAFEAAYQQAQAAKDAADIALALNSMGWAQYDLGHFELALEFWERALSAFRELNNTDGMTDALGGIGWVRYLMGEYDAAISNFDRAENLSAQDGDEQARALNLGDKGVVYIAQGRYAEAIATLDEALRITDTVGAGREGSYKGGYLATAYLLNNQLAEADDIARLTLASGGALVNEPVLQTLHGVILARMGQKQAAVTAFERAIALSDKILGVTLGLYRVRYARGLANAGLALLQDASALTNALLDYGIAAAICREAGVRHAQVQLLDALAAIDGERRSPIRDMLR
jgi:DNA-binding winged helix-turn-helix (wHTH) protein/tetratricopeptide (TPR) repeat protein